MLLILTAISLSMDAFSLSLAYGTLNINKKDIYIISIVVGIYHFFMPQFGHYLYHFITSFFLLKTNLIAALILFVLSLQMLFKKEDNVLKKMNFLEIIIFGLAVSIDSFSIGIGLKAINENIVFSSFVFSVTSFIFTFIGLLLGKKMNCLLGKIAIKIGGLLLFLLSIYFFIY
ncbi:MAG: manganese efflux pump [Mycoplasmatota bacterium]